MTNEQLKQLILENPAALYAVTGCCFVDAQVALGSIWPQRVKRKVGNVLLYRYLPADMRPRVVMAKLDAFAASASPEGTPFDVLKLKDAIADSRLEMGVAGVGMDFGDDAVLASFDALLALEVITEDEHMALTNVSIDIVQVPVEVLQEVQLQYRDELMAALNGGE
jgi:hypothetical protein